MAGPVNGTPVNFGFSGADGIVLVAPASMVGKLVLQTADQSKAADLEVARDGTGEHMTHGWYNIHDEATLEFVIKDTTQVLARANTTLAALTPGVFVNINACPSRPDLVATTWEIQAGAKIVGGNTNFAKISLPLHKYPNITAVAI